MFSAKYSSENQLADKNVIAENLTNNETKKRDFQYRSIKVGN